MPSQEMAKNSCPGKNSIIAWEDGLLFENVIAKEEVPTFPSPNLHTGFKMISPVKVATEISEAKCGRSKVVLYPCQVRQNGIGHVVCFI